MDTYIIANNNLNAFKALNLNNIELIEEDMLSSTLPPLKGDLIYIDSSISSSLKQSILEKYNLFAQKTVFNKGDKEISVFSQNIFNGISEYKTTTSGSVASDTITHSTLDVEKVAREAYEDTKAFLLNVDYSSMYASSNIWRKVVNNINEDYPNIELMNLSIEDFNIYFSAKNENIETILVDPYFKNIVQKGLIQNGFKIKDSIFINDVGTKALLYKI
ncbi:MAG: hypothetical protein K5923_00290 [Clostridia bacterium]|nr:hypothetical protein [Clostridia bacterium]